MDANELILVDFDQTLVHEDTLRRLYALAANKPLAHVVYAACRSGRWRHIGVHRAIKEAMYREILSRRTEADLQEYARQLAARVSLIEPVMHTLRERAEQGAQVWIVSASLEVVVRTLARELKIPHDRVVGSLARRENGVFNGALLGGECVRGAKAQRLVDQLASHVEHGRIVAYGNLPADREFLELAHEAYVVRRGVVTPFTGSNS